MYGVVRFFGLQGPHYIESPVYTAFTAISRFKKNKNFVRYFSHAILIQS